MNGYITRKRYTSGGAVFQTFDKKGNMVKKCRCGPRMGYRPVARLNGSGVPGKVSKESQMDVMDALDRAFKGL